MTKNLCDQTSWFVHGYPNFHIKIQVSENHWDLGKLEQLIILLEMGSW